MRIRLVKFGLFDFESVGDGANEPTRALNFHGLVTKERGDPGWVSRGGGGEGTRPVFEYWFETRSFFRTKNPKIQTLFRTSFTPSCFKVVY